MSWQCGQKLGGVSLEPAFVNQRRPIVLVTGATGFVGRALVLELESGGWEVRRAVRQPSRSACEIAVGSIGPTTDWERALAGVEAVVHTAARVHHPKEAHAVELYRSVNADGTMRLARSAANAGVRKFVFISTILVNGGSTDGRSPFREADCIAPRGAYGLSKAEAEFGLNELANESRMSTFVIRPPLIYGFGARGNFQHLVKAVQLGVPLPFGSIRNRRAFVSVENLVSFVATLLRSDQDGFKVYLVADAEQISTPEFIERIARAMRRRPFLVPFPVELLEFALHILRPDLRDSIIGSMEVDTSSALSTGWKPRFTMDEGLRLVFRDR